MKTNEFGYPSSCEKCKGPIEWIGLNVTGAYYKKGNAKRLMIVGQDPTIDKNPQRVQTPLMLDDPKSRLSIWLRKILSSEFDKMTIYATNIVKCTFNLMPSYQKDGGFKFLNFYYQNCKSYLRTEIFNYLPNVIISLGEPSHKYISELFGEDIKKATMKKDFNGVFKTINIKTKNHEFLYTPCLHIKTFNVAETYGEAVIKFKNNIKNQLI